MRVMSLSVIVTLLIKQLGCIYITTKNEYLCLDA